MLASVDPEQHSCWPEDLVLYWLRLGHLSKFCIGNHNTTAKGVSKMIASVTPNLHISTKYKENYNLSELDGGSAGQSGLAHYNLVAATARQTLTF